MSDEIPNGIAYLATPYSRWKDGPEAAFKTAAKLAAHLLRAGIRVYSPICHTHPIAWYGGLDALDHAIWLPFDEAMMEAASVLIVAHLEGWDESVGVAHEIRFFEEHGKPIYDLDPRSLLMKRRTLFDGTSPVRTSGEIVAGDLRPSLLCGND